MHILFTFLTFLCAVHYGQTHNTTTQTVFIHVSHTTFVTVQSKASAVTFTYPDTNTTNTNIKAITTSTSTSISTSSSVSLSLSTTTTSLIAPDLSLNITLPSFPLSNSTLDKLTTFLTLLTSVPDTLLTAAIAISNDTAALALKSFFTSTSSCLQNLTSTLSTAASALDSELQNIGADILSDAKKLTSILPGAVSTALGEAKSIESKITGVVLPGVETKVSELVGEATEVVGGLFGGVGLPFRPRGFPIKPVQPGTQKKARYPHAVIESGPHMARLELEKRNITSTLGTLSSLTACLSISALFPPANGTESLQKASLFEVGACALDLAGLLIPAAKILKLKSLIQALGGTEKVVKSLKEAKDTKGFLASGNGVVGLFEDLLGITDLIKDCAFLTKL